jgi:Ca-activated chloride channel homolog
MSFAWPFALLWMPVPVLLLVGYLLVLRRRRRRTVPYSSVALLRAAGPPRTGWRRHLPVALLAAALALLGLAAARPQVRTEVPVAAASVILALDVSGSMCATDVDPNRLTAAQRAVRDFVRSQNAGTRIGLVVFSGSAQLAVPPTTGRRELLQAIDSLTTGRGTTIGAAILKSVDAIAAINPDVAAVDDTGGSGTNGNGSTDRSGNGATGTPAPQASPAPGSRRYTPEIVVLLTDGANTSGVTPLEAAAVAASRGVRVYPIGFGTTDPTTLACTAAQLGGNRFDNFGGGGRFAFGPGRQGFLVADEGALRAVATITGGSYFPAKGADQLQGVLADLPRHVQVQSRDLEITVLPAGLAALLVLLSVWASARWTAFPG